MKFTQLEGLTKLAESVTIYIPSTINVNEKADFFIMQSMKEYVKTAMAETFGGFTMNEAVGGYKAENGKIVEETVYLVRSNTSEVTEADVKRAVAIAKTVKRAMNQECVSLEINGELYFV